MRGFKSVFHSLQLRVFLALVLIIFIFVPGTAYIGYLQAKKTAEDQIRRYALSTAVQIAERIRSYLSQHTHNLHLLKALLEEARTIAVDDPKGLIRYFQLLKKEHPEFVNIYLGDSAGRFTMVPPQAPHIHKVFDPRMRPWYRGAVANSGLHWTEVYLFASTQKPGITASVPIRDAHGRLTGVCGIDIDLTTFSRFLQGIKMGPGEYAYIIENKKGRVIAHPELARLPWRLKHVELLSACLRHLRNQDKKFGTTPFQGADFFTAYTDYPENDWTVGVTLPEAMYLQNINAIKKVTLTIIAVAVLLACVLSYFYTLTVIKPLKNLQQGIERISRGDLQHQADLEGPDVVQALARSFNRMALSLQHSRKELRRTYIELAQKEKMAAVGQMTAGIAHEIKNPLGIILGSAQVAANPDRPAAMRAKAAHFIVDEVERLNNTLKAFLTFAKPAPPGLVPTDMTQLLTDTLAVLTPQFDALGITVTRVIAPEAPLIDIDPDQIRQVFYNIMSNARQAMPDGGRIDVQTVVSRRNGDRAQASVRPPAGRQLHIRIRDTGCGIEPAQLEKIFDPFVSYRDDGVGLGLSIVFQILKLHRAEVAVDSEVGVGTTFCLTFNCSNQESRHAL